MTLFDHTLSDLKSQNRYRALRLPAGTDLTSNDYLGMAVHPALRSAAADYFQKGGDVGSAGSRLLRGHTQEHQDLEAFAMRHFACSGALYFSSGFQANYAILTTLPARGDIVFYDSLVHASMRDGLNATHAKSYKFAHNDVNALDDLLKRHKGAAKRMWIAVESVYSMDGDVAPLAELYALAEQYDAVLIVDEAHGTGVFGHQGKGASWRLITENGYNRLVTVHTCGKSIGVAGGLVCASKDVIEYMINAARPFIYSTAPMPLQAVLVKKSLEIIASDDGAVRREALKIVAAKAKDIFGGAGTQIVPIVLGEDEKAVRVAMALQEEGYDIRAIRPPTVPEGTARLRLSLSAQLDEDVLLGFANALKRNL